MTCSVRCGTVKIRYLDCDRLCTALKIRAYRSCKHSELIFVCRLNADYRIRTEHIRTDIQGCTRAVRRHICLIRLYHLSYCINKSFLGEYRHFHTLCRAHKTLRIKVGSEHYRFSVLGCICFHALKNSLCILQNSGALAHCDGIISGKCSVVPMSVLIKRNVSFVCFYVAKSDIFPVNILLFHD